MPDAVRHPLFARFYAWFAPLEDRTGVAEHRRDLVAGLRGRVLELGAGPGLSFRHFPPEVERLVAVEPEPTMRANAAKAARDVALDVELLDDTAEAIAAAGFELRELRRFRIGPTPAAPHILGVATAPP